MKWSAAETILIDLAPGEVVFNDQQTEPVALAPVIYILPNQLRVKVVAVGEPGYVTSPAVRVELFSPGDPPAGVSKLDCLRAFSRYVLATILQRYLFRVKPTVVVRGGASLVPLLGGYERDLVAQALLSTGAKRVQWTEEASQK